MTDILEFLRYLIVSHGYWATIGIISISTLPLLLIVYLMFSRSSLGTLIDKKIAERWKDDKILHKRGSRIRKQFTADVQDILQEVAEHTNANRVILFEFSNGTNNLVGLPFLFMTASAEVASPGFPLMTQSHQRLNTSIIAQFLIKLEKVGYVFINDSTSPIKEFQILGQIMQNAQIQSALFYSLQGIDEAIGFLVFLTTKSSGIKLDLHTSLQWANKATQKIVSMINFDEIEERERKTHKFKWLWQK